MIGQPAKDAQFSNVNVQNLSSSKDLSVSQVYVQGMPLEHYIQQQIALALQQVPQPEPLYLSASVPTKLQTIPTKLQTIAEEPPEFNEPVEETREPNASLLDLPTKESSNSGLSTVTTVSSDLFKFPLPKTHRYHLLNIDTSTKFQETRALEQSPVLFATASESPSPKSVAPVPFQGELSDSAIAGTLSMMNPAKYLSVQIRDSRYKIPLYLP